MYQAGKKTERSGKKIEVLINSALSVAIASVGYPSLPCGRKNRKISQPGLKKILTHIGIKVLV